MGFDAEAFRGLRAAIADMPAKGIVHKWEWEELLVDYPYGTVLVDPYLIGEPRMMITSGHDAIWISGVNQGHEAAQSRWAEPVEDTE